MQKSDRCLIRPTLILSNALSGGGAEAVARLMLERIKGSFGVVFENDAKIRVEGRPIWIASRRRSRTLTEKILINCWRVLLIQWAKVKVRPRVTVSHLEGPNFANIISLGGGRKVIFVHNLVSKNYSGNGRLERIKTFLIRVLYRRADLIVGVSLEICDELTTEYGIDAAKVSYLPNPIDIKQIETHAKSRYGDWRDNLIDDNYIVSVASFTEQKNHDFLIEVFSRVRKVLPELKLVLVGSGCKEREIHRKCIASKLVVQKAGVGDYDRSADVYFLGFQPNPYPILANAQLFVLPSKWEGLPISLLEALALNKVCLVANCSSGIRQILFNQKEIPSELSDRNRIEVDKVTLLNFEEYDRSQMDGWISTMVDLLKNPPTKGKDDSLAKKMIQRYDINSVGSEWSRVLFGDSNQQ